MLEVERRYANDQVRLAETLFRRALVSWTQDLLELRRTGWREASWKEGERALERGDGRIEAA